MSVVARRSLAALAAFVALAASAGPAQARPTYFETFTSLYGITSGENLYACGVCHLRWTGTGARNPFGSAVEQQLYLGKSITQSLQDVEAFDSDGDGFTNVDEIVNFLTLPGYSCSNFFDAINAPLDYHTYVTPMVASCLEPLDIRLAPASVAILTNAGESLSATLQVFNNGSDFPVNVSAYAFLAGTHAAFSVSGPAAPFAIPVGASVDLTLTFAPATPIIAAGTLRISSDDPDEADIDVPLTGVGAFQPLAPAAERAACLRQLGTAFRRYSKNHLKEWSRCYLNEVSGVACDAGTRDLKIQQGEARLRSFVGGASDQACAGQNLTPALLGFASTCGGGCGDITVVSLTSLTDCLVCRQEEAMRATLAASAGSAPPDLPSNTVGSTGARLCQKKLLGGVQRAIATVQKVLGSCELDNVTAGTPVDCATTLDAALDDIQAKADSQIGRCTDTAGLLGCLFEPGADPTCVGTSARATGVDLVDASWP